LLLKFTGFSETAAARRHDSAGKAGIFAAVLRHLPIPAPDFSRPMMQSGVSYLDLGKVGL
jgi:hypothetical protein